MTDPHPDGLGVSTCIKLALKDSKIERDEVGGYLVMGESLRACC
jgi:3-oxoacyl-(acyl-carrier-protein) synthase